MSRRLLAVLVGGLPALAFPEPAWWWFAWVALVPWLWLLQRASSARDAAWLGWCGGLGFMLASHWWLVPNLLVFLPVVCAVLALLWVPFGLAVHTFLGERVALGAAAVVVPSAWLLVEVVRSVDRLGGPWGLLGTSQWNSPALPIASVGGVWLVSWLVVLVNVLVLAVVARRDSLRATAGLLVVLAASLVVVAVAPAPSVSRYVSVGVVQPGVVDDPATRFDRGEELTRTLIGTDVDLVVWGESSVGFDLVARADLVTRLSSLSADVGAPLLVNVDARSSVEVGISKASVLVDESGEVARYDKTRLVPFGEYVPLRPIFGWASSFLEAADEDRVRGDEQLVVMPVDGFTVGPVVCFESAFPDMTRTLAAAGADLLVAQAATSTFQDSWAPEQHASLAAVRAVESGRPVVHSTLTGVTTAFDALGRQVGSPLSTSDVDAAVLRIPLVSGSETTLFVRLGSSGAAWAAVALAVVCLAVVGTSLSRRRRRQESLQSS